MKYLLVFFLLFFSTGCSSMDYKKTVSNVDIDRFMGKWYVIAGRFTFLEKGAHNAIEIYSWNEKKERIDIDFKFNKNSFTGKIKEIPQKAWIHNQETKAHWKVSPFWPLKLDYLVIALDDNYEWVAIGVPNQNYLWIMARDWNMTDAKLESVIKEIEDVEYSTKEIVRIPQQW